MTTHLKSPELLQMIAAIGTGCFFGAACLTLPPIGILIGLAGVGLAVVAILKPELVLLGLLVITSTFLNIEDALYISIGIGRISAIDIILIGFLALIIVRSLVDPTFKLVHTPLDWPLITFYGVAIVSTGIAILTSSITFNQSLGEVRIVNYYWIFFIVTNLIREERQARFLIKGLLFLACLVAIMMVIQFLVGPSLPFLPGRVEVMQTGSIAEAEVARILPPGQSLVLVMFISFLVWVALDTSRPLSLPNTVMLIVLGLANVFTFNRNFWIAIGLSVAALVLLVRRKSKFRIGLLMASALFVGGVLFGIAFAAQDVKVRKLVQASAVRLTTLIHPDTVQEESLQYRYIEDEYAFVQIAAHPLIGSGLGSRYRPQDPRLDPQVMTYERRSYIHNGHLWLLLKTGFLGYFCLLCAFLLSIGRGLRSWQKINNPNSQAILLSFSLTLVAIAIAAVVNPIYSSTYWVPLIAIILGLNEVILRKDGAAVKQWTGPSSPKTGAADRMANSGNKKFKL